MSIQEFQRQVAQGERFTFGRNWSRFLAMLDEERIAAAEESLRSMLGLSSLERRSFLDVGSGSGLFSLAAMRLGAERVHSFDFDPLSVTCTRELRARYFPDAPNWQVEQGSALDVEYVRQLGQWDIVYSWGVLHHTGDMWRALGNVSSLVRSEGMLFISIYNDQGTRSRRWRSIKRVYNQGWVQRWSIFVAFASVTVLRYLAVDLCRLRNPLRRYAEHDRRGRGMSVLRDWHDWLGGYPFEVAKPEAIFDFYRARGYRLERLTTRGGSLGCNEFVFRRPGAVGTPALTPDGGVN